MDQGKHHLDRREFVAGCAAFALSLPALAAGPPSAPPRTVTLPDGTQVPALGQGAWHLGQERHPADVELEAVRTGVSLGMTLIDTSGNYGNGRSEKFIGRVIAGERARIYLVSKVEADEVAGDGIARACEASLARLGTGYLDLYLLHAPVPEAQFAAVVAGFEKLRKRGQIRAWGVSNFDLPQMQALLQVPDGRRCATNQVAYSLINRRIERELLPWSIQHNIPVMAYSPLGGDNHLVVRDPTLAAIAAAHGCSPAAVALAWVIRSGKVIAIPESGSPEHARGNAAALTLQLTAQEIQRLSQAYPIRA